MGGATIAFASFVTVIAAVAAFLISQHQPRMYAAQAEIVFQPTQSGSGLDTTRLMTTQTLILKSRAVLSPVAERIGIPVERVERSLQVDVVSQSNVMRLTVTDRRPDTAMRLADAISRNYVHVVAEGTDTRLGKTKALLKRQITQLSAELGAINDSLARLQGRRDAAAGAGSEASQQSEEQFRGDAQALVQRIGILQDRIVDVDVDRVSAAKAGIVTPAHRLPHPVAPTPLRSAAAGGLVGVVLAMLSAILMVRWQART